MAIQILHYEFMGPIRLDEWGPPMEEVVYALLARSKDRFSLIFVDQCTKSEDVGFFTKNPRFKCWMDQAGGEGNLYVAIHPMFGSSVPDRRFAVGKIVSKYSPHCNMVPAPEQTGEESWVAPSENKVPARPSPEQDDSTKPLGFVDPEKEPKHYVRRYLEEESYRDWFHKNYPGRTIYQGLGISEDEYHRIVNELGAPDCPQPPGDSVRCACCGSDMRLERKLQQSSLYRCDSCGISETRLG